MPKIDGGLQRKDPRRSFSRDLERYRRREPSHYFFRALVHIGSIGWPIVGFALAGVFLGRTLDEHFSTGVRCTLMLLMAGTGLGTGIAFRILKGGSK